MGWQFRRNEAAESMILADTTVWIDFFNNNSNEKDYETYIHASDIYRECRKKGVTIRKTIDCLIGAIAIENNLALLNNDADFVNMAKCIDLKLL